MNLVFNQNRNIPIRVFVGFQLYLENKPNANKLQNGIVYSSSGSCWGAGYNHLHITFQKSLVIVHIRRCLKIKTGTGLNKWDKITLNSLVIVYLSRAGQSRLKNLMQDQHEVGNRLFDEIGLANSVPYIVLLYRGVPGNEQMIDSVHMSMRPGRKPKQCDYQITPKQKRKVKLNQLPDANEDSIEESASLAGFTWNALTYLNNDNKIQDFKHS